MFAILETGGKQYKVQAGDIIEVETIEQGKISKDNVVYFDQVLLIKDKDVIVGQPYIKNGTIQAKILEDFKAPKVIIFKKKSKKGYRRTRGHRQHLHRIQIEKIEIGKIDTAERKEETAAKTPAKAGVPQKKEPAVPAKKPAAKAAPKAPAKAKKTTTTAKSKTTTTTKPKTTTAKPKTTTAKPKTAAKKKKEN